MAKDAEGNGYSPLATTGEGMYLPFSTWSGQIYPVLEEDRGESRAEDAATDALERVIVLEPVN